MYLDPLQPPFSFLFSVKWTAAFYVLLFLASYYLISSTKMQPQHQEQEKTEQRLQKKVEKTLLHPPQPLPPPTSLIGGRARVRAKNGGYTYRALVLTVQVEDGTAEILTCDAPETELTVSCDALSLLEPFEQNDSNSEAGQNHVERALQLKLEANDLCKYCGGQPLRKKLVVLLTSFSRALI